MKGTERIFSSTRDLLAGAQVRSAAVIESLRDGTSDRSLRKDAVERGAPISTMIGRREFIMALGAAAAWRLAARAPEPPKPVGGLPVIGYLGSASENPESAALTAAFRQDLNQSGYIEGPYCGRVVSNGIEMVLR
jgi:hypothetical protein